MVKMTDMDEEGNKHSQIAPAFYHTYAYVDGKKLGMIKPNKFVAERISSSPIIGRGITTKLAPMLVPPKRWSSWDDGGYWYTREEVMRTRASAEQKAYLKEASDSEALSAVYRALDILGETCWTINRNVFDVVITVWNSGEALADIPQQASGFKYPVEPKSSKWDVKERLNWIQNCKQMSRTMQNAHSLRCTVNYKLEIARAVLPFKFFTDYSSLESGCISLIISILEVEHTLSRLISIILEMICAVDCYFFMTGKHLALKV
jgi:DNA-directed RNA polymerase, mitochondrial